MELKITYKKFTSILRYRSIIYDKILSILVMKSVYNLCVTIFWVTDVDTV